MGFNLGFKGLTKTLKGDGLEEDRWPGLRGHMTGIHSIYLCGVV